MAAAPSLARHRSSSRNGSATGGDASTSAGRYGPRPCITAAGLADPALRIVAGTSAIRSGSGANRCRYTWATRANCAAVSDPQHDTNSLSGRV